MDEAVRVWRVPLLVSDGVVARYVACLSEDESARADRFRFEADRRKFVVARGTLRYLLGERFDCAASAITFCYGKYGKPETSASPDGASHFHFNLSHSGEMALCALGGDRNVGVDIEKVKPIQRLGSMMDRCLVEVEKLQVTAQPEDEQSRAFLQYWTCKEAYLKAIGLGLAQSMTTVEVDLSAPKLVTAPKPCAEEWQLYKLDLPESYVGALVVAGKSAIKIDCWQH